MYTEIVSMLFLIACISYKKISAILTTEAEVELSQTFCKKQNNSATFWASFIKFDRYQFKWGCRWIYRFVKFCTLVFELHLQWNFSYRHAGR